MENGERNWCLLAHQAVEKVLTSINSTMNEIVAGIDGILNEVGAAVVIGPVQQVQTNQASSGDGNTDSDHGSYN